MHRAYETLQRNLKKKTNTTRTKKKENVSNKKSWNSRMTQVHVEPLPIPLIKGNTMVSQTYIFKTEIA